MNYFEKEINKLKRNREELQKLIEKIEQDYNSLIKENKNDDADFIFNDSLQPRRERLVYFNKEINKLENSGYNNIWEN